MKDKAMKQVDAATGQSRAFAVGDLAVYPAHGVGRIDAIESKVINGEQNDFYIMKIIENGMVIMIPTWNVDSVGLREVITEEDIQDVYDIMKENRDAPVDNQTWNRRYREYMEKMKTGSCMMWPRYSVIFTCSS